MKTKILTLGENQDYNELDVRDERIHKYLSENGTSDYNSGEKLIEVLRVRNSNLQLEPYGTALPFKEEDQASYIRALRNFFTKIDNYAQKHGINYALLQNLRLSHILAHNFEISGLVQLLK